MLQSSVLARTPTPLAWEVVRNAPVTVDARTVGESSRSQKGGELLGGLEGCTWVWAAKAPTRAQSVRGRRAKKVCLRPAHRNRPRRSTGRDCAGRVCWVNWAMAWKEGPEGKTGLDHHRWWAVEEDSRGESVERERERHAARVVEARPNTQGGEVVLLSEECAAR
jgi:hypothetical protein